MQNGYTGWLNYSDPSADVHFDDTNFFYDMFHVYMHGTTSGAFPMWSLFYPGCKPPVGELTTYWAWNNYRPNTIVLETPEFDGNKPWAQSASPPDSNTVWHRYEWVKSGTSGALKLYIDGVMISNMGVVPVITEPLIIIKHYGGTTQNYIDDFTWGTSIADMGGVSTFPHDWYIKRDLLDPLNVGVYDNLGGSLMSSTVFHVQATTSPFLDGWTMATAPNTRYTIEVTTPIGTHAYETTMNFTALGSPIGTYAIPINATHIGNAPLEYGFYNVKLYSGGALKGISDYFLVTSGGATILFDKDEYRAGEPAVLTYAISPAYYDTVHYGYTYKIVNIYGETKSSDVIPAASGSITTSIPASCTQGVHYVELIATDKANANNVYILGYDYAEVVETLRMEGYVMNAETGATLQNAQVNITQGSVTNATLSKADGSWNSSVDWTVGSLSVVTNKTGYTTDIRAFTPLSATPIPLNISLMPDPPTYSGISIGGIVRDDVYGNPVPAATVVVQNGTSTTATTNIAGYYRVDYLVQNTLYKVWSSKAGYSNSTVMQKVAAGI